MWEIFRDRLKIHIDVLVDQNQDIVYITNASKNDVVVVNYKIHWAIEWMGDIQLKEEVDTEIEPTSMRTFPLKGASTYVLTFGEPYRLPSKGPDKSALYIELTIAGRKEHVIKKLYGMSFQSEAQATEVY